MKIVSLNVNNGSGIEFDARKVDLEVLEKIKNLIIGGDPDVICLQEIKAGKITFPGYVESRNYDSDVYPGSSGVAIYLKKNIKFKANKIKSFVYDALITQIEIADDIILINLHAKSDKEGGIFYKDLRKHLSTLDKSKKICILGDMNIHPEDEMKTISVNWEFANQIFSEAGLEDVYSSNEIDDQYTFNRDTPCAVRLDYAYISKDLKGTTTHDHSYHKYTDHSMLILELDL